MTGVGWSADQYVLFERQRTRPARDLLHAVPEGERRTIVDLGCGPGNSTALLVERFPDATVTGVDSSEHMLAQARRRLPRVRFAAADIAAWSREASCDLIFSNAALQWLPDHDALLPRLAAGLAPGGCLAIQMPDNLDEPSHRAMREAARSEPWANRLAAAETSRTTIASPSAYYDMLRPLCAEVEIWRTVYQHPLNGAAAIVAWFEGSGLRPYLAGLDTAERADFLARYQQLIEQAYPPQADGKVLLAFPRLFIVATR